MAEQMTLDQISAENLNKEMKTNKPPVLINALSADDYAEKRIPGSVNIPAEKADWIEGVVPDKDQDIVVYCASDDCPASPELADKLQEKGYHEVLDFEEGMQGWKEAGFKLTGHKLN